MMMRDEESNFVPATVPPPEPMFDLADGSSGISVDDENPGLDRGHSLPNVDELKMDHKAKSAEFISEDGQHVKRRSGWVVWVALIMALLVIAVIIGVAVAVTKNSGGSKATSSSAANESTPAPTPPAVQDKPEGDTKEPLTDATPVPVTVSPGTPPTSAPVSSPPSTESPEVRLTSIKAYLVEQGISGETDLNTEGSPQHQALYFMAVDDAAKLSVPAGDKTTPEGYDFITRYVLSVLFYETLGDRWVYSLNFMEAFSVCYWYSVLQYPDLSQEFRGVACTDEGQIAALFMTRNNMEGNLPTELSQLTTLAAIDMNFNLMGGPIPDSYQSLSNMQNFFMMSNRITGAVPAWIDKLSSMKNINLSHNIMTGSLPTSLGNMQELKGLALDNNLFSNNLNGVFDTSAVKGLRKLEQLYLENNKFTGTLGTAIGLDANLTHFDISDNMLKGDIPSHLFTLPNLEVLDLHDNDFSILPSEFPPNEKLELLTLNKCKFGGQPIPSSISKLSALRHLDLSENKFTGQIPSEIGTLANLTYLFLAENDFTSGEIPAWIEGLKQMEELDLKSTRRTGPIPTFLGTLTKLVLLDLDDNALEGAIPESLGDLTDLHILLLNRNNLTSTIPSSFTNLINLKLFFVEGNVNVTGDLNELYCTNPSFLMKPVLVATCDLCGANPLECCTACCTESDEECNPGIHVPDLDPIWQLGYKRVFFTFGREDFFDKDARGAGGPNAPGA